LYLEEILQNFITNAIKYTQKGSVTLRIRKTREGVHFAVKDSGIGISKADQKRIFEKFYRSEDYRTRESSGTGLGLYVVQKLSHKLSTTIEVSSQLNHGSEFSFTLPRK
jgi:signal transduction histidine kinase